MVKKQEIELKDDFGFSLVTEEELKAYEKQLKKQVEEQSKVIETIPGMVDKLNGLRDMIMPFLNNLAKDPDKTHIVWPDRSVKIKEFINKINKYVDGE
jgi:hypothetical protein